MTQNTGILSAVECGKMTFIKHHAMKVNIMPCQKSHEAPPAQLSHKLHQLQTQITQPTTTNMYRPIHVTSRLQHRLQASRKSRCRFNDSYEPVFMHELTDKHNWYRALAGETSRALIVLIIQVSFMKSSFFVVLLQMRCTFRHNQK